jgi:hypothetical protein
MKFSECNSRIKSFLRIFVYFFALAFGTCSKIIFKINASWKTSAIFSELYEFLLKVQKQMQRNAVYSM